MAITLGPATIAAQQKLSEQFGIPTFNLTGDISTVPVTKPLSDINVGVGKFTGETFQTLSNKLSQLIGQASAIGGQIGNTIFNAPEHAPGNAGGGTSNTPKDGASGQAHTTDKIIESLDQFKNFVGPSGLLAGLILVGLLIATRK